MPGHLAAACSTLEGSTLQAEAHSGSPQVCACRPLQVSFFRSNLVLRVLPKQFGQTKDKKDIQLEAMIDYIRWAGSEGVEASVLASLLSGHGCWGAGASPGECALPVSSPLGRRVCWLWPASSMAPAWSNPTDVNHNHKKGRQRGGGQRYTPSTGVQLCTPMLRRDSC